MSRPMLSIGARSLATLLPDLRLVPGPVYLALADSITVLVRDGRLVPDTRLPSERELAAVLTLSRATVTAAYDQLRQHGLLASRTGAGSFVTVSAAVGHQSALGHLSHLSHLGRLGRLGRPGHLNRWTLRIPDADETIDLTCAAMPAPTGVLERALIEAGPRLSTLAGGTGYDPMGLAALRTAIAERFTRRGLATSPDQILVTSGALHAFDLLLRTLTGPGDRVLTELPSYPGALDAIRTNGARVVPVALARSGGWDLTAMQAALRQMSPRLAYVIPDYHNPTGGYIDDQQRRAFLTVARSTSTTVIVDESFVDLGLGGAGASDAPASAVGAPRHTASLDSSVVTIGSLSKPIWGGLRVGWVRASGDLVRRLAAQRAASDMTGSALDQLVGASLFEHLDEIVELRRAQLAPRRDALLAALARELPNWRAPVPAGGVSVWVELDAPLATTLSLLAAQVGVQIVPGSRFGIDGTLERFVRVPYTLPPDQLDDAVCRLAAAWSQLDRSARGTRPLVVA